MARDIGEGVKDILENPDPTKSASLVLVAEGATSEEVEERVKIADGEIRRELPSGVFIAEVSEDKIGELCEGDVIDSISLDERLQLA